MYRTYFALEQSPLRRVTRLQRTFDLRMPYRMSRQMPGTAHPYIRALRSRKPCPSFSSLRIESSNESKTEPPASSSTTVCLLCGWISRLIRVCGSRSHKDSHSASVAHEALMKYLCPSAQSSLIRVREEVFCFLLLERSRVSTAAHSLRSTSVIKNSALEVKTIPITMPSTVRRTARPANRLFGRS